jgi:hypothetical protein
VTKQMPSMVSVVSCLLAFVGVLLLTSSATGCNNSCCSLFYKKTL